MTLSTRRNGNGELEPDSSLWGNGTVDEMRLCNLQLCISGSIQLRAIEPLSNPESDRIYYYCTSNTTLYLMSNKISIKHRIVKRHVKLLR